MNPYRIFFPLAISVSAFSALGQSARSEYVRSFNKQIPFQETVSAALHAIQLAGVEKADSLTCLAHIQVGILYWNDGQFDRAETHLNKGRQMAELLNRWKDAAQSIHYRGLVQYYICDFQKALALYDTAEARYKKLGLDSAVAKIKSHKGLIFNVQGNYAAAIQNMMASFRLQEKMPGYRDQSIPMQFPSAESEKIYFESKLEKDIESLNFLSGTNDLTKKAFTLFNISRDYYYLKKYDSAIRYQHRSSKMYERLGQNPFWSSLGDSFSAMGRYDSAEYYYLIELKFLQERGTQIHRAANLKSLGDFYFRKGDGEQAGRYFDEAIRLNEKLGLRRSVANCLMAKTKLLVKELRLNEALISNERALTISQSIGCINDRYECLSMRSDILGNLGRSAEALTALRESLHLRDSIASGESQYRVTQMQLEYDSDKKSRDIVNLRAQHDLKQAELEIKNLILGLGTIGILLVVVLLVFLLNRMKQRTRNAQLLEQKNRLAEEKNQLLEVQTQQKEALLHEIHHRVKNNLQIISSLINLKAGSGSPETNEILKQLGNRIFSMGLVHEQLYQRENVQSIRLDEYLNELSNYLLDSMQDRTSPIGLEQNWEPITVTVEIAITCGLICNELFTNSVKYAFKNRRQDKVIALSLRSRGEQVELMIKDNGSGGDSTLNGEKSFGLRFMEHLVSTKLNGTFTVDKSAGFSVCVLFPLMNDYGNLRAAPLESHHP